MCLWGLASLGGFLIIETRDGIGVEGRVKENRFDSFSGSSSANSFLSSDFEVLGFRCERRVSLAGWGGIALSHRTKNE